MPRVHLNQTNFTAGEISPEMYGRTDIERYPNGAKRLKNCSVRIQGGAVGREGSIYVKGAKFDASRKCRVLPFVFSRQQAYIIEFGHQYIRFYSEHVQLGAPYEVSTPYTESTVFEIDYAQRGDTMFIFHKDIPTYRLRRFGNTNWDVAPAPWVYQPTTELGFKPPANLTLSSASVGTGRTVTASAGVFMASDVGRDIVSQAGLATITAFTSATVVTAEIVVAFSSTSVAINAWTLEGSPQTTLTPSAATPVGAAITLTLGANGWRDPDDIGKMVVVNGGLVEILSITSPTVANGKILRELSSATAAPALAWSLESSMWGGDNLYPATGTFYQQRLIMANSPGFPRHVFASSTGNVLDFLLGTDDSDAFATPVADADEIRYVASVRVLSSMAYNGEFVMRGGVEKPVAPTNVQITNQSNYGVDKVRPVRVGNELYFTQRAGRKVRAFTYQFTEDSFDAPDITKLANHITEGGVAEMTYQQEPYSRLMCVREDGVIAQATLDRTEGVIAWTPWETDGVYESLATIPVGDADETWAVVLRTINGVPHRFIEYFSESVRTDSAVLQTSGSPKKTWTGLDHLNGATVAVLADDVVMPDLVVSGGQITLPRNASAIQVGLHYEPYIELLPIEFPTGQGTAQGAQGKCGEIRVRLHESLGCVIEDPDEGKSEVIPFRRLGDAVLDQPIPPFSGDKTTTQMGWKKNSGNLVIRQPQPLPFHVLSVVRRVTVND